MRRAALLAPLTGFLLVFFVLPLAWLFSLAVREAEVPRALPRTLAALQGWTAAQPLPPALFPAFAQDLVQAREAQTLADAARRLNYAVNGVRSTLMRAVLACALALASAAAFSATSCALTAPVWLMASTRA